jgi:hypothetical protein
MVALTCEDLAPYGVVLVAPSTPEYFNLLADVKHEISEQDTSRSAILLNRASVAIAATAFIWSFSGRNDRIIPHSFRLTNSPVLLPFGVDDRIRKVHAFWNTILPGSKRLMTSNGSSFGDNTDVRPPAADEVWHGSFVSMGGGSDSDGSEPVKLSLDGVFFVDGGFAGPNHLWSWEYTVFAAEAYLNCAALAQEARRQGTPPAEFFAQVQTFTGQKDERMPPLLHSPNLESGSRSACTSCRWPSVGSSTCANVWVMRLLLRPSKPGPMRRCLNFIDFNRMKGTMRCSLSLHHAWFSERDKRYASACFWR